MNVNDVLNRSEVLKQLFASATGFLLLLVGVALALHLSDYIVKWSLEGTLEYRLRDLLKVFSSEYSVENKSQGYLETGHRLKRLATGAFLLIVGYWLGSTIQSEYITGNIAVIVTVSRVTNFYTLSIAVFTIVAFAFQCILKMLIFYFSGAVKVQRVLKFLHTVVGWITFLASVGLAIGALIVCYTNLV